MPAILIVVAGCTQVAPAPTPPTTNPLPSATVTAPAGTPGAQPLLPDPAAEHAIGDTIRLSGGEFVGDQADLTVHEAVLLVPATGSGDARYAFLVEITGLDAEVTPYNLREFTLRDDQNFEYQPLSGGGQEPRLEFGDLLPEQRVRGWLTFEVPTQTEYVELQYWPTLALEPAGVRVLVP